MTARTIRRGLRVAAGQAGLWPGIALAMIALLTAFVAFAGPRQQAASGNRALARVLADLPSSASTITVTSQWQAGPGKAGGRHHPQREQSALARFLRRFRPPLAAAAGRSWAGGSSSAQIVHNPGAAVLNYFLRL